MEIAGTVVLVTGASSGIGEATARLLAARGAKVALAARSREKLDALAVELPEAFVVPADMTREDEVRAMVAATHAHYGRLDVLVNNAGQGYDAPVEHIDPAAYRDTLELNVVGPLVAMQTAIPLMRAQGAGAIVNISSGTARGTLPGLSAYSSSKRALNGLSLTARRELEKDGIVVSVMSPYRTDTAFAANVRSGAQTAPQPGAGSAPVGGQAPAMPPPDTAAYVAEKIIETIESGEADVLAHDWMANFR